MVTPSILFHKRCRSKITGIECGIDGSVAYYITIKLLQALDCIHSKGIVHRDIKPENIMVEFTGNKFDPLKIMFIDFGFAAFREDPEDTLRVYVGTPEYLHPSVLRRTGVQSLAELHKSKLWKRLVSADIWSTFFTIFNVLAQGTLVPNIDIDSAFERFENAYKSIVLGVCEYNARELLV